MNTPTSEGNVRASGTAPALTPAIERLLRGMYAAFNAKDIDAVLASVQPDVDWPNLLAGGRLHGRDALAEYWTTIFASIDPQLEVESISGEPDGTVRVVVYQVVAHDDGIFMEARPTLHRFTMRDGLVARLDILDP